MLTVHHTYHSGISPELARLSEKETKKNYIRSSGRRTQDVIHTYMPCKILGIFPPTPDFRKTLLLMVSNAFLKSTKHTKAVLDFFKSYRWTIAYNTKYCLWSEWPARKPLCSSTILSFSSALSVSRLFKMSANTFSRILSNEPPR